jgi:hypothetical protein
MERAPKNLGKQHRETRKVKERKKYGDQQGKWFDFGPAMIRELESGQI